MGVTTWSRLNTMKFVAVVLLSLAAATRGSSVVSVTDGPDDYLPMPPYRCIQHGVFANDMTEAEAEATQEDAIRKMLVSVLGAQKLMDNPECGVIDPAWCKDEGKLY